MSQRYATPGAFKAALEQRLRNRAAGDGLELQRHSISVALAVEAVNAYVAGELSEEDLGQFLGASREITETYLRLRGTVEGSGTLKADLSAESKQGAAGVFLGGVYYEHWDDLPDVQRALARAEAYKYSKLQESP